MIIITKRTMATDVVIKIPFVVSKKINGTGVVESITGFVGEGGVRAGVLNERSDFEVKGTFVCGDVSEDCRARARKKSHIVK
jgi:hypothetical protein